MKITIIQNNELKPINSLLDFQEVVDNKVKNNEHFISFVKSYKYDNKDEITLNLNDINVEQSKTILSGYKIDSTELSKNNLKKFFDSLIKKAIKSQQQSNQQNSKNVSFHNRASYFDSNKKGEQKQIPSSPKNNNQQEEQQNNQLQQVISGRQQTQSQQFQQQQQPQPNNQVAEELPEELSEELKKKYNFSIPLGNDPLEKRAKFKKVNNVYEGNDSNQDNIFTGELGEALYCHKNNGTNLHINSSKLNNNLAGDNEEDWLQILSDLGVYFDNSNKIKIKDESKGLENNADINYGASLNKNLILEKLNRHYNSKMSLKIEPNPQTNIVNFDEVVLNLNEDSNNQQPGRDHQNNGGEIPNNPEFQQDPQNNGGQIPNNQQPQRGPQYNFNWLWWPFAAIAGLPLLPFAALYNYFNQPKNINDLNFNEVAKPKSIIFDVKKYGSLFEIIADTGNDSSYRFQIQNNDPKYQDISNLILSKNDASYDFKKDAEIQKELAKLLEDRKIEKYNYLSSNNKKKDAIINKADGKAHSYSYHRDNAKNSDINVNFGYSEKNIENKDEFEKLIYGQGVKNEFFIKIDDKVNDSKYVKFSLYWDEKNQKPAISLAKHRNRNGTKIMLYDSRQELCSSVAKEFANFKNIQVSFQLYYNRDEDGNKALCFIDNTTIESFLDSSKLTELELGSYIMANERAVDRKIIAEEREFTPEEMKCEADKINKKLDDELKEIPYSGIIIQYIKNKNQQDLNLNPNHQNQELTPEQQEQMNKVTSSIKKLKTKYITAIEKIDPNYFTNQEQQPRNIVVNPISNQGSQFSRQSSINL